jgi:FdhE protein
MTLDIKALIEQRPHLKDPLELYVRWQQFQEKAMEFLPEVRSSVTTEDSKAYPRAVAGAVFDQFVAIFDLPAKEFAPLAEAMAKGELDFLRLPLGETPDLAGVGCSEEELARVLFLLSRPYLLALRQSFPLDGSTWENGRCPLCSARASLASVVEGPKRHLHCSFCGTPGLYRFIGCPNCENTDTSQLTTIMSEDEPGFRVVTCDSCRTYTKVMDHSILKEMTVDLADMASLPLDIVTQGKGYARMAPNPIGFRHLA